MSSRYQKIFSIPPGFPALLKNFSREILRQQARTHRRELRASCLALRCAMPCRRGWARPWNPVLPALPPAAGQHLRVRIAVLCGAAARVGGDHGRRGVEPAPQDLRHVAAGAGGHCAADIQGKTGDEMGPANCGGGWSLTLPCPARPPCRSSMRTRAASWTVRSSRSAWRRLAWASRAARSTPSWPRWTRTRTA